MKGLASSEKASEKPQKNHYHQIVRKPNDTRKHMVTHLEANDSNSSQRRVDHRQGILSPQEARVEETDTGNHNEDEGHAYDDEGHVTDIVDEFQAILSVVDDFAGCGGEDQSW